MIFNLSIMIYTFVIILPILVQLQNLQFTIPVLSVQNPEDEDMVNSKSKINNPDQLDISYEYGDGDGGDDSFDSDDSNSDEEDTLDKLYVIKMADLRNIGCYDVWENKMDDYLVDDFPPHNSLISCANLCKRMNTSPQDYVIAVRDKSCYCPKDISKFSMIRVNDSYCNIPCPESGSGREVGHKYTCGGHYTFTGYCIKSRKSCIHFQIPEIQDIYNTHQTNIPNIKYNNIITKKQENRKIRTYRCGNCSNCLGTLRPTFDYIPGNTRELCVKFCMRRINSGNEIRDPMGFAVAGWVNKSSLIPACGCVYNLTEVSEVKDEYCDASCGLEIGGPSLCGSKSKKSIVSIYNTQSFYGNPPTSPAPTTPYGSTTFQTQSPSKPTSSTTPNSSEEENEESDTVKPPITQPIPPVCKKCFSIDQYNISWNACHGEIKNQTCPNGASGMAYWECLQNGKFKDQTPNYENCKSGWIGEIRGLLNNNESSASEILLKIEEICRDANVLDNIYAQYFGHEIKEIMDIIQIVIKHQNLTEGLELTDYAVLTQKVTNIGSSVFLNPRIWNQLPHDILSSSATSLIFTLEESGFVYGEEVGVNDNMDYRKTFESDKISLISGIINRLDGFKIEFGNSYITLPEDWGNILPIQYGLNPVFTGIGIEDGEEAKGIFLNNISGFGENEKSLNGKIISLSLIKSSDNITNISFPDGGVKVNIQHSVIAWYGGQGKKNIRRRLHFGENPAGILGTAICVYWDTTYGVWSQDGCKLVKSDNKETHCDCSHLTSFAILMDRFNYIGKPIGLEMLTLILSSLSVVSLFGTIIIFSIVKTTHGIRTTITKHLAFCLLIGNTFVLLVVDRHYFNMSEGFCIGAGILTHYAFLSGFFWMGIEGYHLYKMMIQVFDSGDHHTTLLRIFAYGSPLIIVIITGVIGIVKNESAYGGPEFCWLNGYYIYAFMIPVAIVVAGNLVVLFITLRTAYRVKSEQTSQRPKSYKTWIRGCFSITILLGTTWIFGYFQLIDSSASNVFAYIFTILNASQGFLLFIYHCLLNDKVRLAAERRNILYPAWFSVSNTNNTTTSGDGSNGSSKKSIKRRQKNTESFYSNSESKETGKEDRKINVIGSLVIDRFNPKHKS